MLFPFPTARETVSVERSCALAGVSAIVGAVARAANNLRHLPEHVRAVMVIVPTEESSGYALGRANRDLLLRLRPTSFKSSPSNLSTRELLHISIFTWRRWSRSGGGRPETRKAAIFFEDAGELGHGKPAVAGRRRAWGAEARLAGGTDCVACTGAKLRPGGVFFLSHLNQFCYVSTILILPKITDREGTGPANEEHHRLTGPVRIGKLDSLKFVMRHLEKNANPLSWAGGRPSPSPAHLQSGQLDVIIKGQTCFTIT